MKKILVNTTLLLFSFFFIFFIIELIFFFLNPSLKIIKKPNTEYNTFENAFPKFMIFDDDLGWKLKPNFENEIMSINKNGFRSSSQKDFYTSLSPKILVLGDSMVFGNLLNKQELLFSENLNKIQNDYLFINTGVSGWSTLQEYIGLKEFIKMPNIKKIILFHTVSNDMWTNIKSNGFFPYVSLKDNKLQFFNSKKKYITPSYKRLFIYQYIDNKFLKGRDAQYLYNKIDFWIRDEKSYVWKTHIKLIKKINDIAKQNSLPLVIIDIPTQNQIKYRNLKHKRLTLMNNFCKENQIIYYNLLEHYPEKISKLFFKNDSHWNDLGHEFISSFIMKRILK